MVLKTGELERVLEDSRSAMGRPLGLGEVFVRMSFPRPWKNERLVVLESFHENLDNVARVWD